MSGARGTSRAKPLGRSLLDEGVLNEQQLRYALQIQQESPSMRRLGEILVELGYITRRQLRRIARKYDYRLLLGSVLVESGALPEERLRAALADQERDRRPLGEVLVARGDITEEQLAQALSRQLDYPYMMPNRQLVDQAALQAIPERLLREHCFLPLFSDGEHVTVVVHDPFAPALRSVLEARFGKDYELAVAPRSAIERVLREALDERTLFSETPTVAADAGGGAAFSRYVIGQEPAPLGPAGQVMRMVDYLITDAIAERASDIHIETLYNQLRVRYRIDGILVNKTDLPKGLYEPLCRRLKMLARMDTLERNHVQDGHIYVRSDDHNTDLRVSIYPTVLGSSITIRVLTKEIGLRDLSDLGMLPRVLRDLREILDSPSSFVLFSGPTGAGKTTSLYSCLSYLNENKVKICTLESPVEFSIEGIAQHEVGSADELPIRDLLRSVLHQDPDVIVLGEITDEETGEAVIQAALSGHKVFSTVHAEDALSTVLKLMDRGMRTYLLSSTALMVFSQRLVRMICPECREPHVPPRDMLASFAVEGIDPDDLTLQRGRGCPACRSTGFHQRTGVFEMLALDDAVRHAFLSGADLATIRHTARQARRYLSLREAGFIKAYQGATNLDEAYRILSFGDKQSAAAEPLRLSDAQYWAHLDRPAL